MAWSEPIIYGIIFVIRSKILNLRCLKFNPYSAHPVNTSL